jgi:repressor LexA
MKELTELQEQVLAYISACIVEDQRPPTIWEIAEHFGWNSANSVQSHLRALKAKGAIEIEPGVSRGIKVLHEDYR